MKVSQYIINKTKLTNKEVKFIALNIKDANDNGVSVYDSNFDEEMPPKYREIVRKAAAKNLLDITYLYRICFYKYFNQQTF